MKLKLIRQFLNTNKSGKKIKEKLKSWDFKLKLTGKNILNKKKPLLDILFYPEFPFRGYKLARMCYASNYNITSNIKKSCDIAIFWQDRTFKTPDQKIFELAKKQKVINIDFLDISKEKVDRVFTRIFGYSSFINPLSYSGKALKKSNENALKDCTIIECPIKNTEPGYVYQKFYNNEIKPGILEEFRFIIINNKTSYIYARHYGPDDLFIGLQAKYIHCNPQEHFSKDELLKIDQLIKEFNLDYGELDVMRDQDDQKLYVIDVNTTPGQSPSSHNDDQTTREVYEILTKKIQQYFQQLINDKNSNGY